MIAPQDIETSSAAVWLLRAIGFFFLIALIGLVLSCVNSIRRALLWRRISK